MDFYGGNGGTLLNVGSDLCPQSGNLSGSTTLALPLRRKLTPPILLAARLYSTVIKAD